MCFLGLTVQEKNLEIGAFYEKDNEESKSFSEIYERFPILKERKNQDAFPLLSGKQQMLAMGRALMSKPRLLLLDDINGVGTDFH